MLLRNQFLNSTCEAKTAMDDIFERSCCVRGYHVYKAVWTASVGEPLICEREPENASDCYAVAVKKEGTIIGHLATSKAFTGVFTVFAALRCHRMYGDWVQKILG